RLVLFLGLEKHVVLFAFDLNLLAEINVLYGSRLVVGRRFLLLDTDQFDVGNIFYNRLRVRTGLRRRGRAAVALRRQQGLGNEGLPALRTGDWILHQVVETRRTGRAGALGAQFSLDHDIPLAI